MRVLEEIARLIATTGPSAIIPASEWAERIRRDISGSAFTESEILDEIVCRAAEIGVPVRFGASG